MSCALRSAIGFATSTDVITKLLPNLHQRPARLSRTRQLQLAASLLLSDLHHRPSSLSRTRQLQLSAPSCARSYTTGQPSRLSRTCQLQLSASQLLSTLASSLFLPAARVPRFTPFVSPQPFTLSARLSLLSVDCLLFRVLFFTLAPRPRSGWVLTTNPINPTTPVSAIRSAVRSARS